MQEIQEKYYTQTKCGAQKAGITVGKIHGHDISLLPQLKPQKGVTILPQFPSHTTSINQSEIVTNVLIRGEVGRAGLRRKVPDTNLLLKPKVLSQSSQM